MQLETPRLRLQALNARQLNLWTENLPALEVELGVAYQAEPLDGFFRGIIKAQSKKVAADPAHYLYHTFWLLIRKSDQVVIGSADYKDVPDADGAVEIGYGLGKAFEHNGYMSEAIRAMCVLALAQQNVSCIIAETERQNAASQNVLKRCGFEPYREADTVWWRLSAND